MKHKYPKTRKKCAPISEETRAKMAAAKTGLHWHYNEYGVRVWTESITRYNEQQ